MGSSLIFYRAHRVGGTAGTLGDQVCLPVWGFCLALALGCSAAQAEQPREPQELLRQLNNVSIDPSQIYFLRGAQLTRDRVKIYLNRGFIGFLSPVGGEITGAVFAGDGEILLIPPNPVEKASLARFIQAPILEERLTSAYLRFTDQTAKELLGKARLPDPEDIEQPTGFVERWGPLVRRLSSAHTMRILEDFLGDREFPLFFAQVQGMNLGLFDLTDDERLPEAVRLEAPRRSRENLGLDVWYSFPSRASDARSSSLIVGAVQVHAYKIETRLNTDYSLEGSAELELESRSSGDRVLVFELSRQLKVLAVKDHQGQSLVWFQNPALEDSEFAARGNDSVAVILPSPHPQGEKFSLIFAYRGDVITDAGNGVLYVGARGSWYPSHGCSSLATYDLTFHYPGRFTLLATGKLLEETASEGLKHSRWVSDGAFPAAGFSLGAYPLSSRRARNAVIEVYANRAAEPSLGNRHIVARSQAGSVIESPDTSSAQASLPASPAAVAPLVSAALPDSLAESAAGILEYFESLFGPYPYSRLAISQISGNVDKEWPELVYIPTRSLLPEAEGSELSSSGEADDLRQQTFLAHEIAHQWWGNQVRWKTYRDQWLSEGFATYAAALYRAREKDGERKFHELLRGYKQDLLNKTKDGNTIESRGPIWLGFRLSNSFNPEGHNNIVSKKACWVLHMLRLLMTDSRTRPDERFFNMLRDFAVAFRSQAASTEDFIRHAENYMAQASDLDHNRRLDWFFNEWVYGAGIPTYQLQATIRRLGPKKFSVQGTIEQTGVPQEFEMLVPVVAQVGKEKKITLGQVVVTDSGGRFRFVSNTQPLRVAIDEDALLAVASY